MTESKDGKKAELENYAPEPRVLFDTSLKTKSLVGVGVSLKDKNPHNVIELIGDALGIHNYETNIASFWFLDFIALQILQFDNDLDENGKSVLIGWLAGEMQLVREEKLSHDAFWGRMKEIFDKCSKQPLLRHWDFIIRDNKFNDLPSVEEEKEDPSLEPDISHRGMTGSRASTKSQRKMISSRNRSRQSVRSLRKSKMERVESSNNDVKSISKPQLLDVVKEATYNMYGDIFHYSLIVAAFIQPVFIIDYKLPYELRVPRPIKIFNAEKSKKFEKSVVAPRGSTEMIKKTVGSSTGEEIINRARDTKSNDVINDDDYILMEQRRFILPLMDSNEADSVLKEYKLVRTK